MDKMLAFSKGIPPMEFLPPVVEEKSDETFQAFDPLFKYVFGTDPVTGNPVGDLSVYLGKDANPDIKMFIENMLMQPNQGVQSQLSMPTDVINQFNTLSDDDFARFSRNHDETREEYADRIRSFLASERLERAKNAERAKLKQEFDDIIKSSK